MAESKKPLSEAEIADLLPTFQDGWTLSDYGVWVARAVERAHGIKMPTTSQEQHGQ